MYTQEYRKESDQAGTRDVDVHTHRGRSTTGESIKTNHSDHSHVRFTQKKKEMERGRLFVVRWAVFSFMHVHVFLRLACCFLSASLSVLLPLHFLFAQADTGAFLPAITMSSQVKSGLCSVRM